MALRSARKPFALILALACAAAFATARAQDVEDLIARIKPSVVAVGTLEPTRSPAFQFLGTGFVVGDGTLVVTNVHVLPAALHTPRNERIAVAIPSTRSIDGRQMQVRDAKAVARDADRDLAVLRIEGPPLRAMTIGDSTLVREGRSVHFTGFPIGSVLGLYAATHRAIVAAITPIAIPQPRAAKIDAAHVRKLALGAVPVFQLDGIAYPGNSGSPVWDGEGRVIGVVNMAVVSATKESLLKQPSGLAYAVPAEHVRSLIGTLR
jgi:S1-C subfamily serine protease